MLCLVQSLTSFTNPTIQGKRRGLVINTTDKVSILCIVSFLITGDDDFCSAGTNSSTSSVTGRIYFPFSLMSLQCMIPSGLIERMTHRQCDRGQGDCDGDDDCLDVRVTLTVGQFYSSHIFLQGLRVN